MPNSAVSVQPGIQRAKHPYPQPCPQATLNSEKTFHFLGACDSGISHWSWSWALFGQLEGETVEASAPWRCYPVTWPCRDLSAGDRLGWIQSLSSLQALMLTNVGFHTEEKARSWCVQDSALETSGLMTDMLVPGDRAVQLRKVARAWDLGRSSGPHKKAMATGERLGCWVPSSIGLLDKATHSIFVYRTHFQGQVFYSEAEVVKELFIMKISTTWALYQAWSKGTLYGWQFRRKREKRIRGKTNKNSWDHSAVIKKQILQFYNTKY